MNIPLSGYGPWDNHPDFPVEEWRHEVYMGDTRREYWEWVRAKMEEKVWDDDMDEKEVE